MYRSIIMKAKMTYEKHLYVQSKQAIGVPEPALPPAAYAHEVFFKWAVLQQNSTLKLLSHMIS